MFNMLCYNKDGDLVMVQASAKIQEGDILTVDGKDYEAKAVGSPYLSQTGTTCTIDLAEYREAKKKAV